MQLRRHILSLLAVAVGATVLVVAPADEAEAAVPDWAEELAQDAIDTCLAIPEAVMGDGFASVAFVAPPASAGPHLIGVTGTGAGSAAATGGVVVTGAKAALAAGVFAGVFCGGIAVLDWLFGTKPVPTVPVENATSTGLRECSSAPASGLWADLDLQAEWDALDGRQPGDRCVTLHLDVTGALDDPELFSGVRWIRPSSGVFGFAGLQWLPQRNVNGSLTPADVCPSGEVWSSCGISSPAELLSQLRSPDSEKQLVHVVMPCVAPEVRCGLLDVPNELFPWQPGIQVGRPALGEQNRVGYFPAFPDEIANGLPRRMRARLRCKRPGDGHEVTVESHSAMFWDSDEGPPPWQHEKCPSGYAPIEVDVWRQRARGGMHVPVTWTNDGPDDHVLSWKMDNRIRQNSTSLQCWLEGVTSCPIHQVDPADPDSDVQVGGQGGVRIPKPERDIKTDTMPELLADVPWPEQDPRTEPPPITAPTTTAVPTTVPPNTSIPPADPPPARPSPPSPGSPAGEGGAWSTCMEDLVPDDWLSVTFNPVTWVRALVTWMIAPIICAIWWLIVPADGWGSIWDRIRDVWENHGALAPFRSMATINFSSSCLPADFGTLSIGAADLEVGELDVGLCENLYIVLIWVVMLGLAVIGVSRSVLMSIAEVKVHMATSGKS